MIAWIPMTPLRALALVLAMALLLVRPAAAHPAPFSYLDVRIGPAAL
jgi:hypothetical protein